MLDHVDHSHIETVIDQNDVGRFQFQLQTTK